MSPKETSRKEREHQARRGEILEAALKLFSQKGYHQTSMSEIAKAAEFSIGSLYGFFKNKDELFFTLFTEEIENIEKYVAEKTSGVSDPREQLSTIAATLFDYFDTRWMAFNIFMMNRSSLDMSLKEEFGETIHTKQIDFHKNLTEIIKQGIERGLFRALRPEEMAMTFQGLMNGSILVWMESGRTYPLKERVREIMDIFYRGVEKI